MDVTSFGIDHNRLLRGIYVSRKDTVGDGILTTFDVRMKEPNREMVMDTSVMHTIEHLMATFFRAHPVWADKTIYVGPMGCRTGMYVIFKGDLESADVAEISLPPSCCDIHSAHPRLLQTCQEVFLESHAARR